MSRNDSSNETETSSERDGKAAVDAVGTVTTVVEEILESQFNENDALSAEDAVSSEYLSEEVKPTGKALKKKIEAEAREAKKLSTKEKKNRNPIRYILTFLGQVIAQMKKVHWITRKQTVVYTIAVLIFVVICVAFVAGWDVFFNFLMDKIFVRNHNLG